MVIVYVCGVCEVCMVYSRVSMCECMYVCVFVHLIVSVCIVSFSVCACLCDVIVL